MRLFMQLLIIANLIPAAAFGKSEQLGQAPTPDWVRPAELLTVPDDATGLLFFRSQDVVVHLDDKGQVIYQGYRIKILHPNALSLGNLSISWSPESGTPIVHAIKVHRDGQVIDVLANTSFEILRREGQLEAAMLDGKLTAVARIPDLRVGDELEFAYTTRYNDPTLGNIVSGALFLPAQPSPGRFRLALNWVQGQQPIVKMTEDMKPIARTGVQEVEFVFDNPKNLTPPKDAPPRYNWARVVEYSDFPNWESVSKRIALLFDKAATLSPSSPLKQEVSHIAATYKSPMERADAALRLVQQNVRYIYVGIDGGNLTPASAEETWKRRYGDCKAKTVLLLALLHELGIEAEAIMVNNSGLDDGLDNRLPNPGMFDHVLVRARIDGSAYYLDGTLPAVARRSLEPIMPYRWLLPLTAEGGSLERQIWRPKSAPDEVTLFEIDARAGFAEPARITKTTIIRGIEGLKQQAQLSAISPDALLSNIQQQGIGDTWQVIDDVKWHYDETARASVLTISGTGKADWEDDGDEERSMALPGGGFSPPYRRIRAADQNQDAPYYNPSEYSCYVTTVRIPETTKLEQWSSTKGYDTNLFGRKYHRAFDFRDNAIRMVRGSRIEQQEIDATTVSRDNDRIASFDNSKGYIFYRPTNPSRHETSDERVPATYEIDWAADNVPCLSQDSRN